MKLYQMSEWEGATGIFYCNCIDNLGSPDLFWYTPARMLGISPADYIKMIIEKYQADITFFDKEKCFFSFGWTNQTKMRKFKNFINSEARKKNFLIR